MRIAFNGCRGLSFPFLGGDGGWKCCNTRPDPEFPAGLIAQVLIGDEAKNKYNTLVTALENLGLSNTKNSGGHFNHFHIILRPPELRPIEGRNLLAVEAQVAENSLSQYQKEDTVKNNLVSTLLSAALSTNVALASDIEPALFETASAKNATEKIAGSFSNCQIVPGTSISSGQLEKGGWGYDLLPKQIRDRLAPGADGRDFNAEIEPTVRVRQLAEHGVIDEDFSYKPTPGFEGVDTASFTFEFEGKKYLVIQKFIVVIPRDSKPLPWNCKDAWKLPKPQKHSLQQNGLDGTESFSNWSDSLKAIELQALLSAASNVSYTFSELPGSGK